MTSTDRPEKPQRGQRAESTPAAAKQVMKLFEEELVVGRRRVKTGSVRVQKHIVEEKKAIELDLRRDFVEVQRIRKNQIVDSVPRVRRAGQSLIIPVIEEQLVVTKRLVLKEEIHVVRRRVTERVRRTLPVLKETADISRSDVRRGSTAGGRRPLPEPGNR